MASRFDTAFDFLLRWEGAAFENDPNDPGGATKFGIDQRSHPNVRIRDLTEDQAKAIYRANEWTKCRCDELPPPWDLVVFDTAVNVGSGLAVKMLQAAVGAKIDGFIGPQTIAAVKTSGATELESFLRGREHYYTTLAPRLQARYLKGWENRTAALRTEALSEAETIA